MHESIEMKTYPIQLSRAQSSNTAAHTLAIDSNSLFTHGDVVYIQHHGECYLLRRTSNDKLILTK